MTTCPTCNKPVDPLRARNVGVREGKVVAYCSPACAAAAESKPTRVPAATGSVAAAPRAVEEPDSGPIIEVLHEPASGVVTSAPDKRTPLPSPLPAPAAKPATTKESGGKDSATAVGELRSKKPARAATPSGKHLTGERKDSTEAKAGWDWIDEEPADLRAATGTAGAGGGGKRWLLVVVALGVLGAGIYYLVAMRGEEPSPPPPAPTTPAPASAIAPTADAIREALPTITPAAATAQATELLRKHVAQGSPRVQRVAAGALARTGDADAITALATAMAEEKVPAAKLRLAYQLARAGDPRGQAVLVAGLSAGDRSDRLDAAARLAKLGDKRAVPLLSSFLAVSQHRLRAAEELARVGDAAGKKALAQIRADAGASVDEKATATLALLRDGDAGLLVEARALLDNREWRTPAAYALAAAKDDAARPVLVEQLAHVTLRVRAAQALRQLDPGFDATPHLPALVAELASEKDTDQIATAETILLLAGDARWATYE